MLTPVYQWIEAFNAARAPLPENVFTSDAVITDQFPPYVWSGTRVRGQRVTVGSPRAFMIDKSGSRASFVLPATLKYVFDGKPGTDP